MNQERDDFVATHLGLQGLEVVAVVHARHPRRGRVKVIRIERCSGLHKCLELRAATRAGAVHGAAYVTYRVFQAPAGDALIEAIGGYLGGRLGAALPDLFEPGCWNHRRTAHSFSTGTRTSIPVF